MTLGLCHDNASDFGQIGNMYLIATISQKKNKMKKSARKSKISYFGQEVQGMTLGLCHGNANDKQSHISHIQIKNIRCIDFTKKLDEKKPAKIQNNLLWSGGTGHDIGTLSRQCK